MNETTPTEVDVPDGLYDGRWRGYRLRFLLDGRALYFPTERGVDGDVPIQFRVEGGEVLDSSVKIRTIERDREDGDE